jgi:hypothetical protein
MAPPAPPAPGAPPARRRRRRALSGARGARQTDKKSLGAKAMVAEIKEAAERQKNSVEEKSILAVSASAPFASRLVPHLTFAYRDRRAALPARAPLVSAAPPRGRRRGAAPSSRAALPGFPPSAGLPSVPQIVCLRQSVATAA